MEIYPAAESKKIFAKAARLGKKWTALLQLLRSVVEITDYVLASDKSELLEDPVPLARSIVTALPEQAEWFECGEEFLASEAQLLFTRPPKDNANSMANSDNWAHYVDVLSGVYNSPEGSLYVIKALHKTSSSEEGGRTDRGPG